MRRGVRDVAPVGGGLQFRRRVFQHGVDAGVALLAQPARLLLLWLLFLFIKTQISAIIAGVRFLCLDPLRFRGCFGCGCCC